MTPEEQRIAIADACGWKHLIHKSGVDLAPLMCPPGKPDDGFWAGWIPDYVNDLDDMHEAEKMLTADLQIENNARSRYEDHLRQIFCREFDVKEDTVIPPWYFARATAAQRAEAFLRTIGKWSQP